MMDPSIELMLHILYGMGPINLHRPYSPKSDALGQGHDGKERKKF